MIDREIYPNAPLVLFAAEIRHSEGPPLTSGEEAALKRALRPEFPISKSLVVTSFSATVGGPSQMAQRTFPRMMSRDRSTSITFRDAAVVVETTSYVHFEALVAIIDRATSTRQEIAPIDGLERVGIRYIDEVRVPDVGDSLRDWQEWVHPSLLGATVLSGELGLEAGPWQGVAVFVPKDGPSGQGVVLRYGPADGYAVDPSGDLRRPTPPSGPFFLIDIDSYWTPEAQVPAFETAQIHETLMLLHGPVRALFESLITKRLRKEVLRDVSR